MSCNKYERIIYIRNWRLLLRVRLADAACALTGLQHFVWNDAMAVSWKCDVKLKTLLRQSMRFYLKNNTAKFHPDPIWNNAAFGLFLKTTPHQEK